MKKYTPFLIIAAIGAAIYFFFMRKPAGATSSTFSSPIVSAPSTGRSQTISQSPNVAARTQNALSAITGQRTQAAAQTASILASSITSLGNLGSSLISKGGSIFGSTSGSNAAVNPLVNQLPNIDVAPTAFDNSQVTSMDITPTPIDGNTGTAINEANGQSTDMNYTSEDFTDANISNDNQP